MIRVMSVRDRATERTRSEIVESAAALLRDEHPAALTVPAVASRAGVSVRTVYRHFPTKADLIDATSRRYLDQVGLDDLPTSTDELRQHLGRLWATFASDPEGVWAEHRSGAGGELRAARLVRARETVGAAVERHAPSLTDDDEERLVDLVVAMSSSSMFLELVERCGRNVDDAADLVVWAVRTLMDQARDTGGIRP